jgi:cytochrome c biogenesis protein
MPRNPWIDLLSSMRFAVSLLSVIAIASVAGTVVKQGEPYANYLNQFGPFWFRAFEAIGLYGVYNAPWFIGVLAFLVASVSLCLWRNAPVMLREMASFRERLGEQSLRNLGHRAMLRTALAQEIATTRVAAYLQAQGYRLRSGTDDGTATIAAKAGSANRLGYIFAHSAIIAICFGGLLDSNLPLQTRLWGGDKTPVDPNMLLSEVPASGRLQADNLSFRGNMFLPEGQSSATAVLNVKDRVLVQELPFTISLKKFHIEHYSTGQPRLFASDVIVTDRDSGRSFETTIEVNRPLIHRGIATYQASFDDGGTQLRLTGHHLLAPRSVPLDFSGRIGEAFALAYGGAEYRVELTGFRPFNIENVADTAPAASESPGWLDRLRGQLGSSAGSKDKRELRNVGPTFSYKLRDAAGQAREYNNYMLPVEIDGRWMLATGMRERAADPFRYLRIPLDEGGGIDGFLTLRQALLDDRARARAAKVFAAGAVSGPAVSATMREQLALSAERTLETFARGGYRAMAEFLERSVPEAEREQAAGVLLRVLQGVTWEAWQEARVAAGLPRLPADVPRARFVDDALNAVSDSFHYGVPVYLLLREYDEVKASVFQVSRSPGRNIVYLGCALLILGVFVMIYIRERRVWVRVKPDGEVLLGAACNRKTMDFDREFERHRAGIAAALDH